MTKNQELMQLLEPYRDKTLSFGCVLVDNRDIRFRYPCLVTHYLPEGGNWKCGDGVREGKVFFKYKTGSSNRSVSKTEFREKFEILGHPPTLATVLMALAEKPVVIEFSTDAMLEISDAPIRAEGEPVSVWLDLTQSPSEYSEEVSAQLVSLIK